MAEGKEMQLERLVWGQIAQGFGGHGKGFGFCYLYKGIAILRSVLITLTTSGSESEYLVNPLHQIKLQ